MNKAELEKLLLSVQSGQVSISDASEALAELPFTEMGFATIDNHRALRVGHPEVIYGEGKTLEQLEQIFSHLEKNESNVLATRVSKEAAEAVMGIYPNALYNPLGRTLRIQRGQGKETEGYVALVAAGTSDLPVLEEAYETLQAFDIKAVKVVDVGVAGIHRLFARIDVIKAASVVIVVAGMEGALTSVVGGLVSRPVIGVPTSVGYGANFGGISALLTMLNSCASGVTVVNIDNGFGAAYAASLMMR